MSKRRKKGSNRIAPIQKKLTGIEKASVVMNELSLVLSDSQTVVPSAGKVYVFSYIAVKPNLLTDRYPVVQVTGVYKWGFSGINLHIQEPRNYNYSGRQTPLYLVKSNEVAPLLSLPLMKLYQN